MTDFNFSSEELSGFVISKFDFVYGLSKVIDLVNPKVTDHHQRVAFIAGSIAKAAGFEDDELQNIILAAALHDIGVIIENEFYELAEFDDENKTTMSHGHIGSIMLKEMDKYSEISELVKYHHEPWKNGEDQRSIPKASHLLHLADRVEVLINRNLPMLDQKQYIIDKIEKGRGKTFVPEYVDAFLEASTYESFWFNIEERDKYYLMRRVFNFTPMYLSETQIVDVSKMISKIIDFRCCFTSTHSAGVSATASLIAKLAGMDKRDVFKMKIAGYLHDIGKLAIPTEILYKNGLLEESEFTRMKKHTYYTYFVLNSFDIFDDIKEWAAYHHEYLDGSGYPFHVSEERLTTGCRIMTVADIFTALTEKRPYREGMERERVTGILNDMVAKGKIDGSIVKLTLEHYDEINEARQLLQEEANQAFQNFKQRVLQDAACLSNQELISRF